MADAGRAFVRGAAVFGVFDGQPLHIAPAFDGRPGFPPGLPDRVHWFVHVDGDWRLMALRDIGRRAALRLPIELTHDYFANAYLAQVEAAGRFIVRASRIPAPQPATEAPRFWWLND